MSVEPRPARLNSDAVSSSQSPITYVLNPTDKKEDRQFRAGDAERLECWYELSTMWAFGHVWGHHCPMANLEGKPSTTG